MFKKRNPYLFSFPAAILFFTLVSLSFSSCTDDDDIKPAILANGLTFDRSGSVNVSMSHMFGTREFLLEPDTYVVAGTGDTIKATELTYYISNVSLMNESGAYVNLGNYNLIDHPDPASKSFSIGNVPAGTYKKIRFCLGVDSLRNHTGAQTGALDPIYNMLWDWNTGYIFFKLSGRFNSNKAYSFHIGGDASLATVELDLSSYKLRSTSPGIHIRMDIEKFFSSAVAYQLTTNPTHIHDPASPHLPLLVQNMYNMFSITSVQ